MKKIFKCAQCFREFTDKWNKKRKYCSRVCLLLDDSRKKPKVNRIKTECKNCHSATAEVIPSMINRFLCDRCLSILRRGKPEWIRYRDETKHQMKEIDGENISITTFPDQENGHLYTAQPHAKTLFNAVLEIADNDWYWAWAINQHSVRGVRMHKKRFQKRHEAISTSLRAPNP